MRYLLFIMVMALSYTISLAQQAKVQIAHLSQDDTTGLASIRKAFKANNPGYDLTYIPATQKVKAMDQSQVVFVQQGGGTAALALLKKVSNSRKFSIGDIVLLRRG